MLSVPLQHAIELYGGALELFPFQIQQPKLKIRFRLRWLEAEGVRRFDEVDVGRVRIARRRRPRFSGQEPNHR